MQRLLDMIPVVQPQVQSHATNVYASAVLQAGSHASADTSEIMEFPSALDVELCGWDLDSIISASSIVQNPSVNVF